MTIGPSIRPPARPFVTDYPQREGFQRVQTYGVVVVTGTSPERSRIGRDMSVESEWR